MRSQPSPVSPQRPGNRPGLSQLSYRIDDYASVRERLLSQLPKTVNFLFPQASSATLATLKTRSNDDFAIALLDAWAVVADVLTFYQERIANEGYLLTATERRSVLALARSIGYELSPGVAASTYLSFTVEDAPDSPTLVEVPIGTQVMSVPVKDELPQTFETVDALTAHLEWNAIAPRSERPQVIDERSRQLYLSGTNTQLKKEDLLLIVDAKAKSVPYVLRLSEVEEDTEADRTLVHWQRSFPDINTQLQRPQAFVFRQRAYLFGYNAPDWETMPAESKLAAIEKGEGSIQGGVFSSKNNGDDWAAASEGLPNSDILCMAAQGKTIFVGTPDKGIFRSLDSGLTWAAANEGVTSPNVLALHVADDEGVFNGAVFAGTPNGGVFRSRDGGDNWVAINTGKVSVKGQGTDNVQPVNTSLPSTVVRSLLTYEGIKKKPEILVSSTDITVTVDSGLQSEFRNDLSENSIVEALGQSRLVTRVIDDNSFEINRAFDVPNLPINTPFSMKVTVAITHTVAADAAEDTPTLTTEEEIINAGTISTVDTQVSGAGTQFLRASEFVQEIRAREDVETAEITSLTLTLATATPANEKTQSVATDSDGNFQIESNTSLTLNAPFLRDNLDSGTALLLPDQIDSTIILVGTDEGVYYSDDEGQNWSSRKPDTTAEIFSRTVYSLAYIPDVRRAVAGTDKGIFSSTNHGNVWSRVWNTTAIQGRIVNALVYDGEFLFAGSDQGVYRLKVSEPEWLAISNQQSASAILSSPYKKSVRALTTYERDGTHYLFAATEDGLFVSTNSRADKPVWRKVSQRVATQKMTALATVESTSLFLGTQFSGFLPAESAPNLSESAPTEDPEPRKLEWPDFSIQSPRNLDLDTLYPQVLPNSWLVLFSDRHPQNPEQETDPQVSAHRVEDVSTVDRSDFGLSGKITRAALATDIDSPESFGLRSAIALIQSEPLPLAPEPLTVTDRQHEIFADPIMKDTLYLSERVPFLQPDQTVIVNGQHMRALLADIGGVLRAEYEWTSRHQNLRNLVINTLLTSSETLQFAGTNEGLYQWENDQWQSVPAFDYKVIRAVWKSTDAVQTLLVSADQRLYRSTSSAGQPLTWQIVTDGLDSDLSEIAIHTILSYTSDERLFFIGTERGIYRSADDGQTWQYLDQAESPLVNVRINDLGVVLVDRGIHKLLAANGQGLHRSEDNGETWSLISQVPGPVLTLFPHELPTSDSRLWAGTEKGLYFSENKGESWVWLTGLRDRKILSLATYPNGDQTILFAGCDQGIYRSQDNGKTWESIDSGLVASVGRSIVVVGTEVIVGTEQGIFVSNNSVKRRNPIRWEPSNAGIENSQVLSLNVSECGTEVMAGTTAGVFRSKDGGRQWQELSDGLTPFTKPDPLPVVCLQSQGSAPTKWYAGTPEGLFYWQPSTADKESSWQSLQTGLAYSDILTIALFNQNLLVGTRAGGLWQLRLNTQRWSATALNNTDVQVLAIENNTENNDWYAGTLRDGLYRSYNQGRSWQQITQVREGKGTLSSDGLTVTWTGQQLGGFLAAGDVINAQGQSRTVLQLTTPDEERSPDQASLPWQCTIDQPFKPDLEPNTPFTVNTGLTNRNITALLVVPVTNEKPTVYAGTSGSGVFRSKDGGDRWTQINTNLEDLEIRTLTRESDQVIWVGTAQKGVFRSINGGDLWAPVNTHLTNIDVRAIVRPNHHEAMMIGGVGILISADQLVTTPVQRNDNVQIIAEPKTILVTEEDQDISINEIGKRETERKIAIAEAHLRQKKGLKTGETLYQAWLVRGRSGIQGMIRTPFANPLPLQPAEPDDVPVSEVAVVSSPPTNEKRPILLLKHALKYSYDPATVAVHANVVEATHGETIEEVLGSGDGNEQHQQFALKQPPLTYVSAATASGSASTLAVRVEGLLWEEAPALYPLTPQDQQYIVRLEDDGTTFVSFGDGLRGARLPSGEENVIATYRSGIGIEGNVNARQLNILKTRPQGITDVINPIAATGAANRERLTEARVKAPPTVRTLDRIVSLQDFEDFAQGFVGIGKAQAAALWNGETQLVHITLAGIQGAAVPEISQLYRQLVQAIDKARDPIQQVVLTSYDRQLFNVEARVLINPRYESEIVLQAVKGALAETFSFNTQAFGQAITSAQVIAAIQSVEGVTAVDLDALYRVGESKELTASLVALPARYMARTGTVAPAQLLLLNEIGIQLSGVPAL